MLVKPAETNECVGNTNVANGTVSSTDIDIVKYENSELEHSKAQTMKYMKYTSLVVLTIQNVALILIMRYVRIRPGDMFMATTAVIMAEILKMSTCFIIITVQEGGVVAMLHHLNRMVIQQPLDCVKISIPAIIYVIQNNLLYVALTNLEATTFQVSYQLKILTTALFSVTMLQKQLSRLQWLSLLLLFVGIAVVQLQPTAAVPPTTKPPLASSLAPDAVAKQNYILGLAAVITSAILSGFAGVYFEKLLKGTPQSLYVRNIQLGFIGVIFGSVTMFINDGEKVFSKGFFFGYDYVVWIVIFLNSFGGIMVAVVVKYADNILKGFATSCAIVLSCILCVYLFDFEISLPFSSGAALVILSVYMYSKFASPARKVLP